MNYNLVFGIVDVVIAAHWWVRAVNDGAWWMMSLSILFMVFAYSALKAALDGYKGLRGRR